MCCYAEKAIKLNHKRKELLYCEEGLILKKRKQKRMSHMQPVLPSSAQPNQKWAKDCVGDILFDGRSVRVFSVIDQYTREALAIQVDHSIPSLRVVRVLDMLIGMTNSNHLKQWTRVYQSVDGYMGSKKRH
jgi:putative transposase